MLRRMTLLAALAVAALAVAVLALGAGAVFAQEEQRPQEGTIEEDGVFVEANN
jgi:invasion protein IalB